MLKILQTITRGAFVFIAFLVLFSGGIAAAQIQAAMGSVVPLSGVSYTGDTVYLFLTGPNLDPSGVALDNVNRPAANGGTTKVQVDSDGRWTYKWGTGSAGGRLDAGVYTIWVADGPADVAHLSSVDYSTISVVLGVPSITAGISGGTDQSPVVTQPGSMNLTSIPEGASVVINNDYKGVTPLTVSDLDPGTYNVTFSRFGFARMSTPVTVQSGRVSEVSATLAILTGSLFVNTTPAGAQLILDGATPGISPMTFTSLQQGNHTLNVTRAGFVTQLLPVHIAADQTTMVDIALVPVGMFGSGTRAAGLLPATLGACAIVALLFVAGRSRK